MCVQLLEKKNSCEVILGNEKVFSLMKQPLTLIAVFLSIFLPRGKLGTSSLISKATWGTTRQQGRPDLVTFS